MGYDVIKNYMDLDGCFCHPSPYDLLWGFKTVAEQHEIARSEVFGKLLLNAPLAGWVDAAWLERLQPPAINIVVTGRWQYQNLLTWRWLEKNNIPVERIVNTSFNSVETYAQDKASALLDLILGDGADLARVFEDNVTVLDLILEKIIRLPRRQDVRLIYTENRKVARVRTVYGWGDE